jgi:Flp pilus assembly pilin Flp
LGAYLKGFAVKFCDLIHTFWADEAGAVTVDWAVLTAAVVGVGMAGSAAVLVGTTDLS